MIIPDNDNFMLLVRKKEVKIFIRKCNTYTLVHIIKLFQVCQSDHLIHKWCSQPILNRRLHSGDLVFAAGILLSGNNYQKISDFAKFIKLPILCNSSYLKIQRTYLVPSIGSFWAQSQDIVLQEFQDKEIVILGEFNN